MMSCMTAEEDLLVLREIKRIVAEAGREGIVAAGNRAEQQAILPELRIANLA